MKYFAYGSNMNPERMKDRGVDFIKSKAGILRNYKLTFSKICSENNKSGYANIVANKNSIVEGVVYEINDNDILKLDTFEDYPEKYNRIELDIELKDKTTTKAITYIATKGEIKNGLKPTKEYLNHLLKGKAFLSEKYFNELAKTDYL